MAKVTVVKGWLGVPYNNDKGSDSEESDADDDILDFNLDGNLVKSRRPKETKGL